MIKLSYIPAQRRVRCEFTKEDAMKSKDEIEDLLQRAKFRLELEKRRGKIYFFRFFETRFRKMWEMMQKSDEPKDTLVAVTIGAGSPKLKELIVNPITDNDKYVCEISINAKKEEVKNWSNFFLKMTIGYILRQSGSEAVPDPGAIHGALCRAQMGEKVDKFRIENINNHHNRNRSEISKFYSSSTSKDLTLVVYDVKLLATESRLKRLKNEFKLALSLSEKKYGDSFQEHFDNMIRTIRSAARGPERYDIDLPMVVLAAAYVGDKIAEFDAQLRAQEAAARAEEEARLAAEKAAAEAAAAAAAADPSRNLDFVPFAVPLEVSQDNMSAKVSGFDLSQFDLGCKYDKASMVAGWRKQNVVAGFIDKSFAEIELALKGEKSPDEIVVAQGKHAVDGEEPYLYSRFNKKEEEEAAPQEGQAEGTAEAEAPKTPEPTADARGDEDGDVRERQRSSFVKVGEEVARFSFKVLPEDGYNVIGGEFKAKIPELPKVNAGPGVKQEGILFIAEHDGMPTVSDTSITMSKALVHEGDVNLTTGDFDYDGDVSITGSIDTGAKLFVRGNCAIEGNIQEAEVIVHGNLEVQGGIYTREKGRILCTGDMKASFIENSKVRCTQTLTVEKAIVNSIIEVVEPFKLTGDDAMVLGGHLKCFKDIELGMVGREGGELTTISAGYNWYWQNAADRRKARVERMNENLAAATKDLEVNEKRKFDKGVDKQPILDEGKKKVEKLTKIIEQAKIALEKAEGKVEMFSESVVKIKGKLSRNSLFIIADKKIQCNDDYNEGIQVQYKRVQGTHFTSGGGGGGDKEEDKKAS